MDAQPGIDPQTGQPAAARPGQGVPYNVESFAQMRVTEVWQRYQGTLTWGKGQCLAILDDGCDLTAPQWRASLPWGPKVVATANTVEGGDDPTPRPPGYHGTTVGYPSSLHHEGVLGVAYHNHVAHVRCVTVVHLTEDESASMAAGLQWVIDHHERYRITTVNLSPVDDQRRREPLPTAIDDKLRTLRQLNIWVSAPCGNHGYSDGISWPACQPDCFAIGATVPGKREAHQDRGPNTDLLVVAPYTSSSNAYAAACSMILREAIEKFGYNWQRDGATLPEAMMAIFQRTGVTIDDAAAGRSLPELDLLAAVEHVSQPS